MRGVCLGTWEPACVACRVCVRVVAFVMWSGVCLSLVFFLFGVVVLRLGQAATETAKPQGSPVASSGASDQAALGSSGPRVVPGIAAPATPTVRQLSLGSNATVGMESERSKSPSAEAATATSGNSNALRALMRVRKKLQVRGVGGDDARVWVGKMRGCGWG